MGGEFFEVIENIMIVVLEGVIFSSFFIGKVFCELYLCIEVSICYDKGFDVWKVEKVFVYGGVLIVELSGGILVGGVVEVDNCEKVVNKIEISLICINCILGIVIMFVEIEIIFDCLGFVLEVKNDVLIIEVLIRCWDIIIEVDILEEVVCIYGYDEILVIFFVISIIGGLLDS